MQTSRLTSLALIVVPIVFIFGTAWKLPSHEQTHSTAHRGEHKWQYKTIMKVLSYRVEPLSNSEVRGAKCFDGTTQLPCDSMPNTLGAQGWELVTAFSDSLVGGNKEWSGVTTAETFVFKKPMD